MFGKKHQGRSNFEIPSYPAGTFLKTEKGWYYVYNNYKRLPIISRRCLDSWKPPRVVETSEDHPAVKGMVIGVPLKFRNGSLLCSQASGRIYLIVQGKLCHVTNPDVLEALGYKTWDAVTVSLDEINLHEKGNPLNG